MTKDLISVVVPVYNVESYLRECVDSILNQTYTEFELILVDDGSPDGSGKICDAYASKDQRITVIHKENGGLSDARNAGIDIAKGSYITFVDSDDVLSSNYLEKMYYCAKENNVELVQGKLTRDINQLGVTLGTDNIFNNLEEVIFNYLHLKDLEGYACNKLYAIRLFNELELRYPVGLIQEDAWVTYKALFESQGVAIVNETIYFYRVNPESIMNGNFNPKRFDILKVPDTIGRYLSDKGIGSNYQGYLDYFMMRTALKTYNDCLQKNADKDNSRQFVETRKIISEIKPSWQDWEFKYIALTRIIKYFPAVYGFLIKKFR